MDYPTIGMRIITLHQVSFVFTLNKGELLMSKYYCLIIFLFVFLSCNKQSKEIDNLLIAGENLVEQNPDSVLLLLDSIYHPEKLNEKQLAEYNLLLVHAKDKAYKDISEDTLIFQITEYFEKQKSSEKSALANFYSGRVHQSRKEKEKAISAYLKAESFADETDNNNLMGLIQYFIGDINYDQSLLEDAIIRYKKSNDYFKNSQSENKYKNQIGTFNSIGNSFLLNKQNDSAFYYYKTGLDLAIEIQDSTEQVRILQNIGVAYSEIGDYKLAENKFKQAIALSTDEKQLTKTYLNLANCFLDQNQADSSSYYINCSIQQAEKIKDNFILLNTNYLLSQMEEKKTNYIKALEYYKQYNHYLDLILKEREDFAILEVQKKYDFEKIKNSNNRLTIEKQGLIIIALFLFIVVVAIILLSWRKMKNKRESLFEAEQKIEQLEELAKKVKTEDNPIHNLLVQRFDVLKKTALLQGYLREDQKEQGKQILRKFNE